MAAEEKPSNPGLKGPSEKKKGIASCLSWKEEANLSTRPVRLY